MAQSNRIEKFKTRKNESPRGDNGKKRTMVIKKARNTKLNLWTVKELGDE